MLYPGLIARVDLASQGLLDRAACSLREVWVVDRALNPEILLVSTPALKVLRLDWQVGITPYFPEATC